jgi:sugar phosphate isomerase/epimerase
MDRRRFIRTTFAAGAALASRSAFADPPKSPFGICVYSFGGLRKFPDTLALIDHAHSLGAAGVQASLTSQEQAFAERVKARTGELGLYFEAIVSLPKGRTSIEDFERQVEAAKNAGASIVRSACLGTRRYETFKDLASWQQFKTESDQALKTAVPVLEKHKMTLALENHKDWTVSEMLDLMNRHTSPYLGICMDFGNNLALLDSPGDILELIPRAVSTHVKDMSVQPYADGFLLAEVPLGEGLLEISKMVKALKAAHPNIRFNLEMITRDPLKVPCLTDGYWATFPDRGGIYLARALALVKKESARLQPLREISKQSPQVLEDLADENLKICLNYARERFST